MSLLRAYVFRSHLGDCSNGGISGKHDTVLVAVDESLPPAEHEGKPVVKLVSRNLGGRYGNYVHAEPVTAVPDGHVGYMAGGTFIHSSDSRFPSKQPIPLHDRVESYELYERMAN